MSDAKFSEIWRKRDEPYGPGKMVIKDDPVALAAAQKAKKEWMNARDSNNGPPPPMPY